MDNDELKRRVRELRRQGKPPKAIARAVGLSPSQVAPVVRAVAEEEQPEPGEREVAGCWVSPGWSAGLAVEGHPEWTDPLHGTPGGDAPDAPDGLVTIVVTREHNWGKVAVGTYLVDTYCLGVKEAYGPDIADTAEIPPYVRRMYSHYPVEPVRAPIELARELVFGAVEYARGLGFEPHDDFARAADHLGAWNGAGAITFGRDGRPFFVAGPNDDPKAVLSTLERTVGAGNFDYLAPEEVP